MKLTRAALLLIVGIGLAGGAQAQTIDTQNPFAAHLVPPLSEDQGPVRELAQQPNMGPVWQPLAAQPMHTDQDCEAQVQRELGAWNRFHGCEVLDPTMKTCGPVPVSGTIDRIPGQAGSSR
jgi:hypothetical protein